MLMDVLFYTGRCGRDEQGDRADADGGRGYEGDRVLCEPGGLGVGVGWDERG